MCSNPYTPGAGFMPAFLAGRTELLDRANGYLDSIQNRYPQQSVVYFGLRGVGKTVLLNSIELAAENKGILCHHIEAGEDGKFTPRLISAIGKFVSEMSTKEAAREFAKKCFSLLKSFIVTYNIEDSTLGIGMQKDFAFSSGIYADDLTEVLVAAGKSALRSDDTICIFIDEVQYLSPEEVNGLIVAVHRCNQLRLPIMVFCAGLPKIKKMMGDACSYAERLFKYEPIGALSSEAARDAIVEPARNFEVDYNDHALSHIISATGGYPYFIQEFCNAIWNTADFAASKTISMDCVEAAEDTFFSSLDEGFFSVRYDRCSNGEKAFIVAMVKCGELPCTISNVARILGKSVQSISPVRAKLIAKGMIYATGVHAEIDFTVPQFDSFIRRINPELQLAN